jgi:hypothetical protein
MRHSVSLGLDMMRRGVMRQARRPQLLTVQLLFRLLGSIGVVVLVAACPD